MNIAAYCRVSTDKTDQLNSLEAQKEFFSEYVSRTGDTLFRLYADEGISGTKIKNRREFLRMMSDAEAGLFDMVVVKDISRFARNTVDLLQSIRRLKALGIETQFLTASMTSMGSSEFVLTIFGALAQEESANTSKRVKFGKRLNAEKGRVPNLVYGYDKTPGDYFTLSVNQREADTVRKIFDWYVRLGCGSRTIAERLNERGVLTKRGCKWSQSAVCRILSNGLYIGRVINGKQEVSDFLTGRRSDRDRSEWMIAERPELCIVEPELFDAAQRIMRSRSDAFKTGGERHSSRHTFSALIRCSECGRAFRRVSRTYKNTYTRWVCSSRSGCGASSCPNRTAISEDELMDVIGEHLAGLLGGNDVPRRFASEVSGILDFGSGGESEKKLRSELLRIQRLRTRYADMFADDLIPHEMLTEKLESLNAEYQQLESELKAALLRKISAEQAEAIISGIFQSAKDIADIRCLTNSQLRRVIREITVDRTGKVDIFLLPLKATARRGSVPFCPDQT